MLSTSILDDVLTERDRLVLARCNSPATLAALAARAQAIFYAARQQLVAQGMLDPHTHKTP